MHWIILIIAGFFEAAFAACLGMANQTKGKESALWLTGFVIALIISMVLLYICHSKITHRHGLCSVDGYWCCKHGHHWNFFI